MRNDVSCKGGRACRGHVTSELMCRGYARCVDQRAVAVAPSETENGDDDDDQVGQPTDLDRHRSTGPT